MSYKRTNRAFRRCNLFRREDQANARRITLLHLQFLETKAGARISRGSKKSMRYFGSDRGRLRLHSCICQNPAGGFLPESPITSVTPGERNCADFHGATEKKLWWATSEHRVSVCERSEVALRCKWLPVTAGYKPAGPTGNMPMFQ